MLIATVQCGDCAGSGKFYRKGMCDCFCDSTEEECETCHGTGEVEVSESDLSDVEADRRMDEERAKV